ncbi:hypothetical protein TTHERM_00643530 (macronuclear) [Tetrahymena thermophila SB210]|uniref:Trichohyalin-plectin-homology domain-containing protein n=1 Tax=Tetrahymena thermophila (strain SB210) TaxID=312017 RepID=Q23EX8_TETTS|nr:hypothetical protein TTHERM_00643530 [Tetrahymena thermophila SB210]8G2Z_1P Chain 1P, CFAP210 [Tetrahymena thermophila CU428]8G2Z_2P Chain 2P, CFAP210 [Tetrahymena thermophila CU428]8G3D_1P Chain 1P, CFAP210 [Tetrahymena thermophila]8G3D_2P Chain 2P, CFAP210 [Tetrahymena thermophila]EAR95127.2 hypothetical protein TTHERM_00643530 [Tetrahymena thermophila SB210]|eukprot:XP_001015372.2 hypothetical protein TTHERM_00643530 [Tetrahymena thermophila SB210]
MSVQSQSRQNKSSYGSQRQGSIQQQSINQQSRTSNNFNQSNKTFTQKNTIQVPFSEIVRMKENCQINSDPEKERKLKEKTELYELSKQRVKNWPNTIQAIRKKKDETRFEKFKKDEEERRRVDEEEARYQANVKKEIIEKANKQIYEGNDRVKAFQSKLLLVDTLQEREGQIELKKQVQEMEKMREEIHLENMKENIRKLEEEEQRKKEELEEKKRHAQKILREQHEEMKVKYIKRLQDEKIEGEIIKQRALEAIAKEKEEERARREKAIQIQIDTKKGNEVLQTIRAELKEKEKLEDEKIKQYAEKKEKITEMRRLREEMRFKEKQEQRQKLIDEQIKRLAAIKNEEESRINKQIIEAQMKADEAEKKKREAIAAQKKRFDESIQLTLKRKEQQVVEQKMEDQAYQQYWQKKNVQIQQREHQEKREAFNRAKDLQDFHKVQANEKQKLREEAFLNEMDEAEKIKQRLENDDKNFNSWAERMIREWNSDGKDIKPLLKELATYNKKL